MPHASRLGLLGGCGRRGCDSPFMRWLDLAAHARRCQHNEVYWAGDAPYYAFGLGAASYLGARRFSRPRGMAAYRQWVSGFAAGGSGTPGIRTLCFPSSRLQCCIAC